VKDKNKEVGGGVSVAEEGDVVGLLRERRGQATLDEVSEGLAIPKYGAGSAYALLQSLRSKNLVDRKGENWVLLTPEASISRETAPGKGVERGELAPGVEQVVRAMAKTLAEAMMGVREPADEWEMATKPMKTEIKKEGGGKA